MSKEYLEALEGMFDLITSQGSFEKAQKYYYILEEALERLEAIDNANPNRALKSFETLEIHNKYDNCWQIFSTDIKQALLKAEQDKKKAICWDIVVKKNVNIGLLKGTIKMVERGDTNWEYYNRVIMDERIDKKDCLTEEEFNILKEGLEYVEVKNER